jgi:hypothetical protein
MPDLPINTNLRLGIVGTPPFACRNASQALEMIAAAANFDRDVNGGMVDMSAPQFKLYKTTISGTDWDGPSYDKLKIGTVFVVDCISELYYMVGETPERPPVAGSEYTQGDIVFYRPQMPFVCTGFSFVRNEYGDTTAWSIEGEEPG